jgi:hypothetical protein
VCREHLYNSIFVTLNICKEYFSYFVAVHIMDLNIPAVTYVDEPESNHALTFHS